MLNRGTTVMAQAGAVNSQGSRVGGGGSVTAQLGLRQRYSGWGSKL